MDVYALVFFGFVTVLAPFFKKLGTFPQSSGHRDSVECFSAFLGNLFKKIEFKMRT